MILCFKKIALREWFDLKTRGSALFYPILVNLFIYLVFVFSQPFGQSITNIGIPLVLNICTLCIILLNGASSFNGDRDSGYIDYIKSGLLILPLYISIKFLKHIFINISTLFCQLGILYYMFGLSLELGFKCFIISLLVSINLIWLIMIAEAFSISDKISNIWMGLFYILLSLPLIIIGSESYRLIFQNISMLNNMILLMGCGLILSSIMPFIISILI